MGNPHFKRMSTLLAGVAFFIALLGLIGWALDLSIVRYIIPKAFITINPLAGINLLLFAVAFYLLSVAESSVRKTWFAFALISFIFSTSLSVMMDLLFGFSLHIDLLLPALKIEGQIYTRVHTHMAFISALNFVLCSTSLWLTKKVPDKPFLHQALTLLVIIFSLFVVLGHLYGVPEFSLALPLTMALPVAICFILIALALLFSHPDVALTRELTSSLSGSLATRYLIPSAVLLPLLIGYIKVWGHSKLIYSAELGTTLLVLSFIIIFITIVWRVTAELNRRDAQRIKQDEELLLLNRGLKDANEETATLLEELRSSNEELQANNEELNVLNENLDLANRTIARQKDEQLNRVLDSTNDVIWSFDLTDKGENYLSRSAEKIYGEPLEKLIERPRFWLEHIHPDDKPIKAASQYRLEKFGSTECTYRLELPTGIRWIHDRLKLIRNEEGKAVRLEGIASDVTSEKESEKKILESATNLDAILKSTLDGFLLLSKDYKVVATNASYQAIVKKLLAIEIRTGASIFDGLTDERKASFRKQLDQVKTNGIIQYELQQENFWIKVVITTVLDSNNLFSGYCLAAHDITSLKESEKLIRTREEYIRALIENIDEVIAVRDVNQNILFASSNFKRILGYDQWDIEYKQVIHPEDQDSFNREFAALVGHPGKSFKAAIRVKHKNGQWRLMEGVTTNLCHIDSIQGIISNYRDVTEKKLQELELNRSRENLEIIFSNTTDGFLLAHANGEVASFNRSYEELVWRVANVKSGIGKQFLDNIPPQRRSQAKLLFEKALKGESTHTEIDFTDMQGNKLYLLLKYEAVVKNGEVTHVAISVLDVTEKKTQEIIATKYREHLDIIFQNSTDFFILLNAEAQIVLFNRSFLDYTSKVVKKPAYFGMNYFDVIFPNRIEPVKETFQRCLAGEKVSTMSESVWPAGTKFFSVQYTPIKQNGVVTFITISSTDITEQKNSEIKLNEFRENLEIIFETTTDDFLLTDVLGKVVSFNRSYEKFIKEVAGIVVVSGMNFLDVVAPSRKVEAKSLFERALKGEAVSVEAEVVQANGERNFHLVRYGPVIRDDQVTHVSISGVDITKLKLVEEELERDKFFLEKASEAGKIGYWSAETDMVDGKIHWSKEVLAIFELDEENFDGKVFTFFQFIHPDDRAVVMECVRAAIEENKSYNVDHRVILRNGKIKWVNERAQVVQNEKHQLSLIVGISQDITQRKIIEEETERSQYFLEKAGEAGKIGYWTSEPDSENGKLTWSKEVFSIFQMDPKDFDGKNPTFFKLVHPDDRERVAEMARVAQMQNLAYNIDHRVILKDGKVRWVNERAQIIRNENNQAVLMVGIVQDINDRKIIEEVLREYNDRYEILSRATNDVIWDWDVVNDKVVYNDAMTTVMGYDDSHRNNSNTWWEERIHPDDHDRIMSEVKDVFANHLLTKEFSYRYRTASGDYKYIHDRAYVVYNKEGMPVRMIGVMQDVTELTEYRINLEKKVEARTRELNAALKKEKEIVEMRSKFVSIASHEFRTPLSTISLASGFVRKYKHRLTPDAINEKLLGIETQVRHMSGLLDDILTIGKGDAGRIEVNLVTLPVRTLFENMAREVINSMKRSHEVNLQITFPRETFETDEGLIRNIVINLLSNAIKFSDTSNEVILSVGGNKDEMVIGVRDYGIGIPPEDAAKLFEPFYRGSNVSTISGTGLGLSIVKKAVDLLEGEIKVNSNVGRGTEFLVTLPTKL